MPIVKQSISLLATRLQAEALRFHLYAGLLNNILCVKLLYCKILLNWILKQVGWGGVAQILLAEITAVVK